MNKNKLAFVYDIDGTLVDGFITDQCIFTPCGVDAYESWQRTNALAKQGNADYLLLNLLTMKNVIAESKPKEMTMQEFYRLNIDKAVLFPGVVDFFDNINSFASQYGFTIDHFVASAGVRGLIEALPFADKITHIFASEFLCDENNAPIWLLNYTSATSKTEYLFRISKGQFDLSELHALFNKCNKESRNFRFDNMVYFGDGDTDVPAMKVVKRKGGRAIAVYSDKTEEIATKLLKEERVNFIARADYRVGSDLYKYLQDFIIRKSKENGE